MGSALGRQKKRLPRYLDIESDHVRPANHTPLAEDVIGQGRFVKMGKRPLMSLVAGGALPPEASSLGRPRVAKDVAWQRHTTCRNLCKDHLCFARGAGDQVEVRCLPIARLCGDLLLQLTWHVTQGRRDTTPGCPAGCAQMASTTSRTSPLQVAGCISTAQPGEKREERCKTRGVR